MKHSFLIQVEVESDQPAPMVHSIAAAVLGRVLEGWADLQRLVLIECDSHEEGWDN